MAAEITFLTLLTIVMIISALVALTTVARVVEPRGVRVLLRRLAGRP
ncbi:MAG: hypothetical protein ABR552_04260 [Actinomycetota bacterium]